MRITFSMIDRQLRFKAFLFKLIPEIKDEKSFRERMAKGNSFFKIKKPEGIRYEETWIKRSNNDSKVRVLICKPPKEKEKLPCVMWVHGGGFAAGTPEQSLNMIQRLIKAKDCIVVSPDYRLSLEAPYPAALDDCYDTLLWIKNNVASLGISDKQIIVGGDSAGGSLAVSLCLLARDKGDVNIAFQMPVYPALDDSMNTPSMKGNNAPLVNEKLAKLVWKVYLGNLYGAKHVPKYAAPARETDFTRLPPLISYVGGIDPLRDDVAVYAEKMEKAGVKVHFKIFQGGFHGFEEFCPKAKISIAAKKFFIDSFKYAVENYFAPQSDS